MGTRSFRLPELLNSILYFYTAMNNTHRVCGFILFFLSLPILLAASDQIPPTAWRIPIGQPPTNPGGRKPELTNIDDGFWQGAPVGGIGAGTFSRSYRGNFERWHIKAGVHKYQNVPANQFAVFVQSEGGPPTALVLSTGKPDGPALASWDWSYPVGGGDMRRSIQNPGLLIVRPNYRLPSPWNSFLPFCRTITKKPAIRLRCTTGTAKIHPASQ